ncbi:SH3 domain-containing protein [Bradyrhizobium sp. LHD-71]|uniref:SH3 domain-containing protein n=1 Tax=Bradyrhizobium sp. LHD-71 TaxID=3072141 RepID=UPI00280E5C75|nr:SH3 domain-containing protein [Bradyrhizobium sp. LHD-71]MDQ8732841.1 SH3 domain-containing protein [Bradyrhizobium sp. LHD-71]
MSQVTNMNKCQLFAAAVAIGAGGFLAVPGALAAEVCTVPGEYLNLNLGPKPDMSYHKNAIISANGSTLGPTALVKASVEIGIYGNVSGGIQGRAIDFTITWHDTMTQARFTGTVGTDGVARGTSTGPTVPINLWEAGPWESAGPLTCVSTPGTATATVIGDVDVYNNKNEPDGAGQVVGTLAAGTQVQLVGNCRPEDWCQVSGPNVPGGTGWVWGHLQF